MRPGIEAARKAAGNAKVVGVEVGVHNGTNAADMLESWPELRMLHLVDNYAAFGLRPLDTAKASLKPYTDRFRWHLDLSHVAAASFADGFADFVYIDDDHSYKGILISMLAWLPKVKSGGVLAGHDWLRYKLAAPVGEIADPRGLTVQSEGEDWWIEIPVSKEGEHE